MRSDVSRSMTQNNQEEKTRYYDFLLNNQPDALIIQIYSVIKLYVFLGIFSAHHSLLYIRHWYVSCRFLMTVSKQSQNEFHPDCAWKWSSGT